MPKFNLKDLMSERSTKEIQTKERQEIVFRNPKELIPSDENFYKVENVDTLKQSLLLVGVLQPLLIENTDAGDIVIAGHRRRKACVELIEEGHEEFKNVPCIYKTQARTKELSGKEDILRQIALIQANNYRDKSDWERMTETLQMEELIKELRKEMELEGKTRDILKDMINVSSGQVARYHAISTNLNEKLLEAFESGEINVSVAYEVSTLDEARQQAACEILERTGTLVLGDAQGLKTLMNADIPGQMTLEKIIPEFIPAEIQIERFYEGLKKNLKQRIKDRDQNMVSYLLYTFYGDVKIQNRFQNYRGSREGIIFNPGEEETKIPWKEFAEQLIVKHGKKPKPVKTVSVDMPDQEEQKSGRCLYRPESPCTLTTEQKATPGDGEDCGEKCCWNCSEKEGCKYECNVSANRGGVKETKPEDKPREKELKKPDQREREYLNCAAKHLILCLWDWMREDHMSRVTMVDRSPKELKKKLGANRRTRYFETEKGTAHINLFDDYVQLWDEKNNHLGDYDWFYLAASIQSMWNVVSLERAQEERKRKTLEIAPAQMDVWPEDLADIPVPSLIAIKDYLEEEEQTLRDYLECEGLPERTVLRQQLKVAGLRIIRNLVGDALETEDEIVQPELPKLRNNDERKEWLHNYKSWPLRHTDTYTGAKYYEYRFKNGAVLIAEEWKSGGNEHIPEFETAYLHLVGGPEPPKGFNGIGKWNTHETFSRYPESETELVEFLKEVQKDGK